MYVVAVAYMILFAFCLDFLYCAHDDGVLCRVACSCGHFGMCFACIGAGLFSCLLLEIVFRMFGALCQNGCPVDTCLRLLYAGVLGMLRVVAYMQIVVGIVWVRQAK